MSTPITASTILNEQHLNKINEALAKLQTTQKEIEMAKRAGLTTGPNGESLAKMEEQVKGLEQQLRQIKSVYFPNQ